MSSCSGLVDVLNRRAEIEQLMKQRDIAKTELECYRLAKEIYDYLKKHGYDHKKEES